MDLRPFNPSPDQLDRARDLVMRGLLCYQPWVFTDDFECGVGLEFARDDYCGLVYLAGIDPPKAPRFIAAKNLRRFRAANTRLRQLYDGFTDRLCNALGGVDGLTTLDVGCNTGYIPIAFSRRGVSRAVGCDRESGFAATVALLNEIAGSKAVFVPARYDPLLRTVPGVDQADLVTSLAVLCHVSDPLQHLAALGSLARKALFVWTIVNQDINMTIHFDDPRGDYSEDHFPYCFDNRVLPSRSMLRRSFELLGFKNIIELPGPGDGLPRFSVRGSPFYGLLGIR
jgi:SAM-dependent methyltransferase